MMFIYFIYLFIFHFSDGKEYDLEWEKGGDSVIL